MKKTAWWLLEAAAADAAKATGIVAGTRLKNIQGGMIE
jgi:hypothetical protein